MVVKALSFVPKKFTLDQLEQAVENDGGFCIKCGEEVESGVEPDAENYECESCGAHEVFGAATVAIMGLIAPVRKEVA